MAIQEFCLSLQFTIDVQLNYPVHSIASPWHTESPPVCWPNLTLKTGSKENEVYLELLKKHVSIYPMNLLNSISVYLGTRSPRLKGGMLVVTSLQRKRFNLMPRCTTSP